jgi:hypothetical protein
LGLLRKTFLGVISVCLGFLLAFGLAEMAVRVICPQETGPPRFAFDPVRGEIPVPNQVGRQRQPGDYDFTYSNNSLGFRGSREFGPKQPGRVRLLLLGDSFTYGVGVNDDQTFAAQLERLLRSQRLDAEVINAGAPGKGTDYELKLFQTIGAGLQPQVTVLCFFSNDFADNARGEYYAVGPHGELRVKTLDGNRGAIKSFLLHFPGYKWLISWSQAANLVKQAGVDYLVARRQTQGESAPAAGLVVSYAYKGRFSDDVNQRLTEIYVAHLMEAVKQAGSELAFCYIPIADEVEAYRRTKEPSPDEKAIKAIIEARGGTLVSLTPVLAAGPESIRELYYHEGHWTPRTHLQAGIYLAGQIEPLIQAGLPRPGAK